MPKPTKDEFCAMQGPRDRWDNMTRQCKEPPVHLEEDQSDDYEGCWFCDKHWKEHRMKNAKQEAFDLVEAMANPEDLGSDSPLLTDPWERAVEIMEGIKKT